MQNGLGNIHSSIIKKQREEFEKVKHQKCRNADDFDDSIAKQIPWKFAPYTISSSNMRIMQKCLFHSQRLKMCLKIKHLIFCSIFMAVGIGLFFIIDFIPNEHLVSKIFGCIVISLLGIAFFAVGFLSVFFNLKPFCFDKKKEIFWYGFFAPKVKEDYSHNFNAKLKYRKLEEIYAIQFVTVMSPNMGMVNYQLNLVFKDATIKILTYHSFFESKQQLMQSAKKLSEFLEVPLWDAT
ncbi:hypothetical protein AAEX28_00395 [Lentisphaerota bacterium WC36G]|nr:hypothetical protein LJT99_03275 [Lentisphaerae bacterium WC36]